MEQDNRNKTLEYYNNNAENFISETIKSNMNNCYHWLLDYLAPGEKILDLGCGSGRDSKYFLKQGYQVVAIDGSLEICRQASKYIGQDVICQTFQELTYEDEFHGIWASASLLHVTKQELPHILVLLAKALKSKGYLYASFKYGDRERVVNQRLFNDYNETDIQKLFQINQEFKCLNCSVSEDVRKDRKGEYWLNLIAQKIK